VLLMTSPPELLCRIAMCVVMQPEEALQGLPISGSENGGQYPSFLRQLALRENEDDLKENPPMNC
jgi:hypothetical protein